MASAINSFFESFHGGRKFTLHLFAMAALTAAVFFGFVDGLQFSGALVGLATSYGASNVGEHFAKRG